MKPIDTVLTALDRHGCRPKRSGTGWSAQCPAHDDRRPSLSVTEGTDGRVLVCCHAGCATESIVAALGLAMKDLMPDDVLQSHHVTTSPHHQNPVKRAKYVGCADARPGGNGKPDGQTFPAAEDALDSLRRKLGQESCRWTYCDAAGEPVGLVVRWDKPDGTKDIRPISRFPDGWRIAAMPEPRPLYNLPDILKADPATPIFVAEGEKCVEALRQCGLLATTSSGGCNAASKTDWSPLSGRHVTILPDNDEPGRRYAQEVTDILLRLAPPATVRILKLADYAPGLPEGGDVADIVESDGWFGLPLGQGASPEDLGRWLIEIAAGIEPVASKDEWPEVISLDPGELPQFPVHVLPTILRDWVQEEARATQTPLDLPAMMSLGVCSAAIARQVEVVPRVGWIEPVNLFVTVLLPPGNRKSAVFRDALKPLRDYEAELIDMARPEIAKRQSARRQAEARLHKLEKFAGEKDDQEAAEQACELAARLAVEPEPVLPRLLTDDATAEKIASMLAEQKGRLASMSPEGGPFDLMAGLYSKNQTPQFTVYLMAHAGDELIADRVSRKSVRVERPALTCCYVIQPEVIRSLTHKAAFRGRGLLARFIYAVPVSTIGKREIAPPPVRSEVAEAYHRTVTMLARQANAIGLAPLKLALTTEAELLLRTWEAEIEGMLAEFGEMETIRDWGAKLAGATLRVAAVLHCVEQGIRGEIAPQTLAAAIEIGRYLIPHAKAVLEQLSDDSRLDGARWILRWIRRHQLREFTLRDVYRHGYRHFDSVDECKAALMELERRGYVREQQLPPQGPSARNTPLYGVNPVLYTPKGVSPIYGGEHVLEMPKGVDSADNVDTTPTTHDQSVNVVNVVSAFQKSEIVLTPHKCGISNDEPQAGFHPTSGGANRHDGQAPSVPSGPPLAAPSHVVAVYGTQQEGGEVDGPEFEEVTL
ncbi:MAG TPA: DUF3987 domain-containing protein [Thermogutta sp.]|nr:DUF3987 domain-containing protein [Thermogutta sp.]